MNLKEILLTHHSSIASHELGVAFINQHPELFPSLLELTCTPQEKRENIDLIIAICFSYLLTFKQLAPLCFALKTLHFFRKYQVWLEEEMQAFVEKNLPNSSPEFRAAVRQIS